MKNTIAEAVQSLPHEISYKQFMDKLVCSNYMLKGVRIGDMKALAKRLAKTATSQELLQFVPSDFEELTVLGLIIAYVKIDIKEKFDLIDYFISHNDNWASNDTVTAALKNKSEEYFEYLVKLTQKGGWYTRFAVTAMLSNFVDKEHLTPIFDSLSQIKYGEYYVDMAVAWLLSKIYVGYREEVICFLKATPLSNFVLKKTVSKIRDSFCVSKEDKIEIKQIVEEILCKREIC